MDEDDLLTPYKEESFEVYERRTLESSSSESDVTSESAFEDDDDHNVEQIEPGAGLISVEEPIEEPTKVEDANEIVDPPLPVRKRGRPRKPRPPTPDPSQVETIEGSNGINDSITGTSTPKPTPGPKRPPGRPKKGEMTPHLQKRLQQTMECIIPEGTKRQSKPSRFLSDYESFASISFKDEVPSPKRELYDENGERIKRGRGRPRTRPPKVKVLLPDGTPRGRGRPRIRPIKPKMEILDTVATVINENGEVVPVTNGSLVDCKILNGDVIIRRKRGRPRKYPFIEKIRKFPKRVARPGKKLGRPRKNVEKESTTNLKKIKREIKQENDHNENKENKESKVKKECKENKETKQNNENKQNGGKKEIMGNKKTAENKESKEKSESKQIEPTWRIKWNGIFKFASGGKSPLRKSSGTKADGSEKAKKRKRSAEFESNKENAKTVITNGDKIHQKARNVDEERQQNQSRDEIHQETTKAKSESIKSVEWEDKEEGAPCPKKRKISPSLEETDGSESETSESTDCSSDSEDLSEENSHEVDETHHTTKSQNSMKETKRKQNKITETDGNGDKRKKVSEFAIDLNKVSSKNASRNTQGLTNSESKRVKNNVGLVSNSPKNTELKPIDKTQTNVAKTDIEMHGAHIDNINGTHTETIIYGTLTNNINVVKESNNQTDKRIKEKVVESERLKNNESVVDSSTEISRNQTTLNTTCDSDSIVILDDSSDEDINMHLSQ